MCDKIKIIVKDWYSIYFIMISKDSTSYLQKKRDRTNEDDYNCVLYLPISLISDLNSDGYSFIHMIEFFKFLI